MWMGYIAYLNLRLFTSNVNILLIQLLWFLVQIKYTVDQMLNAFLYVHI